MDKESLKKELSYAGSHGEAINKACEFLPDGFMVKIVLEKWGYGVYLVDREGNKTPTDSDGMIDEILEAVRIANGID